MLAVNILNTKHYLLLPLVLVVVVGRTGDVFGMLLSGGATGSTHTDSDGGIGVFSETSSPEAPGLPTNSARLTLTSLTSLCYAQCMAKCLDTLVREIMHRPRRNKIGIIMRTKWDRSDGIFL